MQLWTRPLALCAFAWTCGCGGTAVSGDEECPEPDEADCESTAEVSYGEQSFPEPYDLFLRLGATSVSARCNDPNSIETEENPEWLECTSGGFTITGEEANRTSVQVTVQVLDADDAAIPNVPVDLTIVDEADSGAADDCPALCFEKTGTVVF